jgi:hypothetical protein
MNVKIFGRASGWRAIASTAFDATSPSPTADPNATPSKMIPNERIVAAATKLSEVTVIAFLVI